MKSFLGIEIVNYKMEVIIKKGTLLLKINKEKSFNKTFKTQVRHRKMFLLYFLKVKVNKFGKMIYQEIYCSGLNNDNIIEIKMILAYNSIITVIGKIKREKDQKLINSKSDFYDEI